MVFEALFYRLNFSCSTHQPTSFAATPSTLLPNSDLAWEHSLRVLSPLTPLKEVASLKGWGHHDFKAGDSDLFLSFCWNIA